jgi:hypothetical protein
MVSPEAVASRPTKAEKSMTVTMDFLGAPNRSSCLAQMAKARTIIPDFSLVFWIPNRPLLSPIFL